MKKQFKYKYQCLKVFKIQIVLKKIFKILNTKYYYIKTCDSNKRSFSKLFFFANQIIAILTTHHSVLSV